MGSILHQCLFGTFLCSLSLGVVDAFVLPVYRSTTSSVPHLHTRCSMSNDGEWWESDTAKAQLSQQKREPGAVPYQADLIRDISDFGHPQQRANSLGRRQRQPAYSQSLQVEPPPSSSSNNQDQVRDLSDLGHKQQRVSSVGRGRGQTTAADTPWKRSSSFPKNDNRIAFSWEKSQEKEAPAAAASTSSTTKTSSSRDGAVRSSQEAPKKQHPSSVAVSRNSDGQFQQTYDNDNRRSNAPSNGVPWEAHHRTVNPPRRQPPPPPPQAAQQRRSMMPPPQQQRQQLVFDSDSPLERYERQRKESLQRTQGYINRPGISNNNDNDIIDTGHYQHTDQGLRYVYEEDAVAQPPPSPPPPRPQRQVERERQRVHQSKAIEVDSPRAEAKQQNKDDRQTSSSSPSNLEMELRQLKDEVVEMKEHQESLLKSLLQVQDNLDRAVRMVATPTPSNDDKTQTSNATTVPSTFFFKDHTTWNNATGEIKSATTGDGDGNKKRRVSDDDENARSTKTKTLINGISMTQSSLEKVLKEECGVKKFGTVGDEFDPKYHTAMYEISDPTKKPGTIAEVITDGYYRVSTENASNDKNKILRYAEVAVVKEENE